MTEIITPPPDLTPHASSIDEAVGLTTDSVSPRRQAYIRFKQHKGAVISIYVLGVLVLAVVFTPITARYGVNQAVIDISKGTNQYLSPRSVAWFGTDSIGRDLFSRLLYGVRVSLIIGLVSAVISVGIGVVVGAFAGLKGGLFDDVMMRVTDIFLAFPFLVALLVTRSVLGALSWLKPVVGKPSSIRFLIILFAIFGWMSVARVVRGSVLSLKEREFIEASRAIGGTNRHLILRHMLPNAVGPILVAWSFAIVGAVGGEATLSLFGYGPDPGSGSTSLGLLIADSKPAARAGNWWLVVFPFIAILLITLTISFIGDGLRDATDPKSSQSRA